MPNLTALIGAGLAAAFTLPVLAFGGITTPAPACTVDSGALASATSADGRWDDEQINNARIIVAVAHAKSVPADAVVIALATAMQESQMRNLPGGDNDSIGLFQQRPSQGWGTPSQLASPAYQTDRFYTALLAIPGWQHLTLTQAAQAVQRSAHPDAYQRWADPAAQLLASLTLDIPTVCASSGYTAPAGTPPTVQTAIGWALAQLGTPYTYGGTCTAPHSPDPTRHCDCSSLTQQAYRAAGITLPRTTTEQLHAGTPVTSQPLPGDLIFIAGSHGTANNPRHVGLYIGNGLLIHAPATGDVVKLSPVDSWKPYAAVRRIVNSFHFKSSAARFV